MRPPEKRAWQLILFTVKFAIIQGAIYRVFARQCSSEKPQISRKSSTLRAATTTRKITTSPSRRQSTTNSKSAYDQIAGLERFANMMNIVSICFYCYALMKYASLELLKFDQLKNYRYIDCFIFGRFRFFGRTSKMSNLVLMQFLAVYIVYRYIMGAIVPKRFKFYSIKFLLDDYQQVLRKSVEVKFGEPLDCPLQGYPPNKRNSRSSAHHNDNHNGPSRMDGLLFDTNYYLRCSFGAVRHGAADRQQWACNEWILRPNRTVESWLIMARCTQFMFIFACAFAFAWLGTACYGVGGSMLTNTGFELAYGPACLTWIREQQRQQLANWATTAARNERGDGNDATGYNERGPPHGTDLVYASIYRPGDLLAHEISVDSLPATIPLTNFTQPTLYGLCRVLFDVVENTYWYIEFFCYFIAVFYLSFIAALDVILNARAIKRRLARLNVRLHEICVYTTGRLEYHPRLSQTDDGARSRSTATNEAMDVSSFIYSLRANRYLTRDDSLEICKLQAIVVDHLKLIRHYNAYLAFLLGCLAAIWFGSTVVICVWMILVRSRALEVEFLLTNCGSAVVLISFFSLGALVRSQTRQLYPLVANAMALDQDPSTKKRWMTIVKNFYPKPLYCFTVLESFEISWLAYLKLYFWIFSALVVLANFFYRTVQE